MITVLTVCCILLAVTPAASQRKEKRSVQGLIYDLKHPDPARRQEAARLIGENEIRDAVPNLIVAANDPDGSVRYEVVRALFRIHDTRALQTYINLTRDSEVRIQKIAVEGLVGIYVVENEGFTQDVMKVVDFMNPLDDDYNPIVVESYMPVSEDAVRAIADLLFVQDKGLRKEAAMAVGILRGKSVLPAIQDALEREDNDGVKVELIRSIMKIGDPAAGESVVDLTRDPEKKVHDEAIRAVGQLRVRKAVPQLNEIYRLGIEERQKVFGLVPVSGKDDLQKKVLEALALIGDRRSSDIFEDALQDEREHYRRYGAEGLGRGGDKAFINLLATRYLREKSSSVKLAMGYALYLLGREEHLVELVDSARKKQGFGYLLELSPGKTRSLYPYIHSEKDSVKVKLLDVIGQRGDSSALDIVESMTNHENAEVASAANLAVRRLRAKYPQG